MNTVAKLLTLSFTVRVLVEENATDEQILKTAKPKLKERLITADNGDIENIKDDTECPFGFFC